MTARKQGSKRVPPTSHEAWNKLAQRDMRSARTKNAIVAAWKEPHAKEVVVEDGVQTTIRVASFTTAPKLTAKQQATLSLAGFELDEFWRWLQKATRRKDDLPTPSAYKTKHSAYVKAFNTAAELQDAPARMCPECGTKFNLSDRRLSYCSKACKDRAAKRGRQPGAHRTRGELAGVKVQRHLDACRKCRTGTMCPLGERLLTADTVALREGSR